MNDIIVTIYAVCLLVGIIYTIVAFVMGHIADFSGHAGDIGGHAGDMSGVSGDYSHDYGVGAHGHGEAVGATATGGDIIFGPFSPLVIAFFLTCFGGTGVVLSVIAKLPPFFTLPLAGASGFVLAWVLVKVFNRLLGGMAVSSEVRLGSLIGVEAEVTVPITALGVGEIAYIAMGSRYVGPARSEEQVAIPRHSTVRISRIVGNVFFVRQSVEDELRNLEHPPETVETGING